MPELPEVEVTLRGIEPYLSGHVVTAVVFRHRGLRWPFPLDLPTTVVGHKVLNVRRRGKYLLLHLSLGTLIIHLGMSGHLRILKLGIKPQKHDHFDLIFGSHLLRLNDPRRFGAVLWHDNRVGPLEKNPLLEKLGLEPLEDTFSAKIFYRETRNRRLPIKNALLSGTIVVGVGNIYASESLFQAGINPKTPANRIKLGGYEKLVCAIRTVLLAAIKNGGSTLRNFVSADGQPGYSQNKYFVYNRAGLPCRNCKTLITNILQGQRSTFYCRRCQEY